MVKTFKLTKVLCLVLAAVLLAFSLTACGGAESTTLEGAKIKVGTSGLFGPFSYFDADGKLIGYDIDLLNKLQEMLGFEYEGGTIQDMEYSALTTSLTTDKLDVVAAALCKTSERQEVMDFSDVYCDSGLTIMVNKEANAGVTSEADLAGKKVAVETGTASDYYITARVEAGEDITVERNKAITTAYLSLEQNKVDAVIQDVPGANFYVKQTADTKLQVLDLSFYQGESPYAVAFSKNFKWQKEFKDALAQLQEEGYLDELFNKWCK